MLRSILKLNFQVTYYGIIEILFAVEIVIDIQLDAVMKFFKTGIENLSMLNLLWQRIIHLHDTYCMIHIA